MPDENEVDEYLEGFVCRAGFAPDVCHCGLPLEDHRLGGAAEHNFISKGETVSKDELESVRLEVASRLEDMIGDIFTPQMMLTLVARHPTNRECYIVVTSDTDLVEVAKKLMKEQGGKDAHEKGCNR